MAIVKQSRKQANSKRDVATSKSVAAPSSAPAPAQQSSLQELYARLEKTKPGSAESKQIAEQIVDAIG